MTDTAATAACPSCGFELAEDERFCEACGLDIDPDVRAAVLGPVASADACAACGEAFDPKSSGYCGVCGIKQPAPGDRREAVERDVAAVTDRGRRRARNEDAFAVGRTAGGRVLAVVCDGVSTTTSGDQASKRAAGAALEAMLDADERSGADSLTAAFLAARDAVNDLEWTPKGNAGPPSCTFLAAIATHSQVELSSVGDCRAFWIPEHGAPERLTTDDSWAAEQELAGTMTSEAAHADARAHSITRWLGADADPSWEPRRTSFSASQPGRLVLCSDGLWNYAATAADVADLAGMGAPLTEARRFVDHANGRGGQDNITVVVIRIVGHLDSPASLIERNVTQ